MKVSDWVGFFIAGMLSGPALAEHIEAPVRVVVAVDAAKVAKANQYFSDFFWKKTPGCSISIRKDGGVVYESGYGSARLLAAGEPEASRIPMTPKQRVRVASVSKPVLSIGILHLRDNKLRRGGEDLLDKTLEQIYPFSFQGTKFAKVTVRQILNHTAGFVREPATTPNSLGELPAAIGSSPSSWSNGGAPGKKYDYSNVGYMLLADILSQESGRDFNDYLTENIFRPLAMNSSSFEDPVPLQKAGLVAEGYAKKGTGYEFQVIDKTRRLLTGSGGLMTTSEDLSRLTVAIQEKKILSASSWIAAFTASAPSVAAGQSYGLGWGVYATGEGFFRDHQGGGYGANTLLQLMSGSRPVCAYTGAILCNFDAGTIDKFEMASAAKKMREIFCAP